MASHSTDNEPIDPDVLVQAENFFEDEVQQEFWHKTNVRVDLTAQQLGSSGLRQRRLRFAPSSKKCFAAKTRPKPKDIVWITELDNCSFYTTTYKSFDLD